MAICSHCGGEMTDGISCLTDPVVIDGKSYAPIRWGQELRPRHRYEPEECRDCATPLGGVHHPGCCMERCPGVSRSGDRLRLRERAVLRVRELAGRPLPLPRPAPGGLALSLSRLGPGRVRSA